MHRLGQTEKVVVYHCQMKGTIEERIYKQMREKMKRNKQKSLGSSSSGVGPIAMIGRGNNTGKDNGGGGDDKRGGGHGESKGGGGGGMSVAGVARPQHTLHSSIRELQALFGIQDEQEM